jgi:energy-converting hydrogenase Eha subunit C
MGVQDCGLDEAALAGKTGILRWHLDRCIIIPVRLEACLLLYLMAEKQEREPMKKTVRIALLMVGLVGTFVAASVAQVPAFDGGSIPLCPPSAAAAELCR